MTQYEPTVITKNDIPDMYAAPWKTYRKTTLTQMCRLKGSFIVHTKEGPLACQDGWLAIDADGYPYPIADGIHAKSYEEVSDKQVEDKSQALGVPSQPTHVCSAIQDVYTALELLEPEQQCRVLNAAVAMLGLERHYTLKKD